jgi:hypothetical protein
MYWLRPIRERITAQERRESMCNSLEYDRICYAYRNKLGNWDATVSDATSFALGWILGRVTTIDTLDAISWSTEFARHVTVEHKGR